MRWLRIKEAAHYARCSAKVLYAAVASGELRAARIGRGRSIVTSELWVDEFLARLAEAPPVDRQSRSL